MGRKASEAYLEKLQDPRWQKKRLGILERDRWECRKCHDTTTTLHVHHRVYLAGKDPWEYNDALLVTLCRVCHEAESAMRAAAEESLLVALRCWFWWDDIEALAGGFANLTGAHSSAVLSDALAWLMEDPARLSPVVRAFLDSKAKERPWERYG